ncbi:MAG: DegT/DnrJ/EryC1/StrS family aminotransferase [Candidatus Omnitrophota bacterium]
MRKINVPFIDVQTQNKILKKKLLEALAEVFSRGDFILGEAVSNFEKEFARYCAVKYAVGVNSGTDALFLSLLNFDIGSGDEVICPVYTYIATALSISYTGAKPVFVDIDKQTYNLNPQELIRKINRKTKAIIPVHLYGQPAAMKEILKIARRFNLKIIEDAAQAHGAQIAHKKVGTFADCGCFSFYPTKNLSGCGDGGMITTNSKRTYQRLLMYRDQGRRGRQRYLHFVRGYNSRLDSLQAAALSEKLKFLDKLNTERQQTATLYSKLLKGIPGLITPYIPKENKHVFHIYPILVEKRGFVQKKMIAAGIQTNIIYNIPLHLQKAYKDLNYKKGDFPVAEFIAKQILCLPMYAGLSENQAKYVTRNLRESLK